MPTNTTAGKPITCRAAVATKPEEALVVREVTVAPPQAGEVRVRIICTSLCQSDLIFWKINDPSLASFPRIFGHEAIGVIESVGEEVVDLVEGDTVMTVLLADCGECIDCTSKRSNLCSKFAFINLTPYLHNGTSSRFTDCNGETIYHTFSVSSFSEYTVLSVANVVRIDPTVPPNRACLLSCGVSAGVEAVWEHAQVESGSTVAIFGLGVIGLAVAEGARLCGAARIIGIDINPEKSKIAEKFGVTDFVDSSKTNDTALSQIIKEMTGGLGADYCFECVGIASLVEEAYACCRKGWGKTILLGVARPDTEVKLNFREVLLLNSGKILTGSIFGGVKPKRDIPILVKKYKDGELGLDKFVTHEFGFQDIDKAFELLVQRKCLKCVIWMGK